MADGDALSGTDWLSTGPTSGDLCVRVNDFGLPTMGVKDANGDGEYYAIANQTFNTDNQSVTLVPAQSITPVAPYLDATLCQTAYLHSDTSLTVGSYISVFAKKIEIGSYTRSGGTYTRTPFSGGSVNLERQGPSSQIEFHNNGSQWTVLVGGGVVLQVVSAAVTFGATRRSSGASIMRKTISGTPKQDANWYYGITMSDYIVQAYVGSGAKIARSTASAVAAAATTAILPTNYMNTIVQQTSDIVCTPSICKLQVSIEAWYLVECGITNGAAVSAAQAVNLYLFKNGGLYEQLGVMNDVIAGGGAFATARCVYLVPGDYVQLAYNSSAAIANFFGAGSASYISAFFKITLLNRSLV